MPVLVVSLVLMLLAAFASVSQSALENARINRLEWQRAAQAIVSSAVEDYARSGYSYPDSLLLLANVNGYQYLRSYLNSAQGGFFKASNRNLIDISRVTLTDSNWTYDRVAVVAPPDLSTPLATYLSTNSCGTGAFATAAAWCGKRGTLWTRFETRETHAQRIVRARAGLNVTLAKFAERYNATKNFPTMATASTLASLVTPAYSGATVGTSSSTCVGTFTWQGMPFDCSDLYSRYGWPVYYQQLSAKRILLTTDSSHKTNTGAAITTAVELNLI